MTTEEKLIIYLRNIATRPTVAEAQREARLALRLLGVDLGKGEQ